MTYILLNLLLFQDMMMTALQLRGEQVALRSLDDDDTEVFAFGNEYNILISQLLLKVFANLYQLCFRKLPRNALIIFEFISLFNPAGAIVCIFKKQVLNVIHAGRFNALVPISCRKFQRRKAAGAHSSQIGEVGEIQPIVFSDFSQIQVLIFHF
ncbi:hypothetical protein B5F36_01460 [Anaerofilum sp. An201]|nr:hypothetical protein B5F36_01460 [Anaerofilum sp. An201]